jgi:hypothetical protein
MIAMIVTSAGLTEAPQCSRRASAHVIRRCSDETLAAVPRAQAQSDARRQFALRLIWVISAA